jgi:1,2-diacylglycerol 3-alpha-glucosyltransferase
MPNPIVLAWERFGPYHHARAAAARTRMNVATVELSPVDNVYDWHVVPNERDDHYVVVQEEAQQLTARELSARTWAVLDQIAPEVAVIPGWNGRWPLSMLAWAVTRAVPTVVMSASNRHDTPRRWWLETVKRRLVSRFDAGLVGGRTGADYLRELGIPGSRIAAGYDVVDNAHFAEPAPAALQSVRREAPNEPFFLTSARFVDKKNLLRLVETFALYRRDAGVTAWNLVVLGDGALRPAIEERCSRLAVDDSVLLPGFRQYDELPAWYALASCFVLPSTTEQWGLVVNEAMAAGLPVLVSDRCGCAPDLVRPGANGFTFDPFDVDAMAALMLHVAHGEVDRRAMGEVSRETIAAWGPERFAHGLQRAVQAALVAPPRYSRPLDRALIGCFARR